MLFAALLVAGLAAGCSDGSSDEPRAPSSTTGSATSSTSAPTQDLSFDCEAVASAQQALGDAATAELERLGIDRTAPEAFTIVVLVTSKGGAEYWQAISEAATDEAPQDLRTDVSVVADYWAVLEEPLAAIEVADSSAAAVQAAQDELVTVSQSQPDDALAPAQQRVQDELSATCGTEPEAVPTPSSS